MKLLSRLIREEKGQGLVEYILIIALIAVVCILVLTNIGSNANDQLGEIETALN